MAIFMASTKSISRSKNQSAVAAACYRTADRIFDERYGKIHDYTKRSGVMSADIIMPTTLGSAVITRAELWNLAERSENRKNSRVAREWLVSLPHELDELSRKKLAHDFSQYLADKFDIIADCAIHRPTEKEIEKGADARNFHAHIMLTTRKATLNNGGHVILIEKSICELSDTDRKKHGLSRAKDEVKEIRKIWEELANAKLAEQNHHLIDSSSYQSQGIGLRAQIKLGKNATHLERKGIRTEKGNRNRIIDEFNSIVWRRQIRVNKRINIRIAKNARKTINDRRRLKAERENDIPRHIQDHTDQLIELNQSRIAELRRNITSQTNGRINSSETTDQLIELNQSRIEQLRRSIPRTRSTDNNRKLRVEGLNNSEAIEETAVQSGPKKQRIYRRPK